MVGQFFFGGRGGSMALVERVGRLRRMERRSEGACRAGVGLAHGYELNASILIYLLIFSMFISSDSYCITK